MFYIYILRCSDGSYYIGQTDDLKKRVYEHQCSIIKGYTSKRLPVELVYYATFYTRIEAVSAERKIKKWSRKKKEALIARNWDLISKLSKKKFNK